MPLTEGARLGPFEVVARIGAGGMGEVYQARDTKLGRDVALKTLPELFASDPERLARFEREARTLASLNHPHIAAIYGLEEQGGVRALVMELVEGEDLSARIARGPIALDEALPLARQIADALNAAHEHGVIHRDLKPGNIKVTSDGSIKVLDFGLAKALGSDSTPGDTNESPTITSAGTRAGVVLGTAAYMSPEQARGRPVDKRTDIWAFGCVLYEMLTGRRAFEGDNVTDLLAGIVGRDVDLDALPATTPAAVRRLLRRCFERDRQHRLADASDARLEIDEALAIPAAHGGAASDARPGFRLTTSMVVSALAGASLLFVGEALLRRTASPAVPRPMRFVIAPPPTDPLYIEPTGAQLAVSADGQHIVYVGVRDSFQLYARRVDDLEARAIPGTIGARQPFLSPDGRSVGFWSVGDGEVRKVDLNGGPVSTICKAPSGNFYGASWGPDGTIVFASGGLYRVPASGGRPEVLTTPDFGQAEIEHRWPEILPDGRAVIFTAWGGSVDRASRIAVRSLVDDTQTVLVEGATAARFSATGHLIYYQTGTLTAAAFDPARLTVSNDRLPLQQPVKLTPSGAADFAMSRDGTLVFIPGSLRPERSLVWVDRSGRTMPFVASPDDYWLPRLSPDGRRLAVGIGTDIWVFELASLSRTRVTFGTTSTLFPFTWSADGRHIIFSTLQNGVGLDLSAIAADGSGQPELLLGGEYRQWATSSSSLDGTIAAYEQHPITLRDIWMVGADRTRSRFLGTPYQERAPRFSPDGRWIAYVSNDSDRDEVYVRPLTGPKVTVSTDGGSEPVWSPDGDEIFYRNGNQLMAASVETSPRLTVGRPRLLFTTDTEPDRGAGTANPNFDVTRDGERFIMIQAPPVSTNIVVVLNWFEELGARLRAAGQ